MPIVHTATRRSSLKDLSDDARTGLEDTLEVGEVKGGSERETAERAERVSQQRRDKEESLN